MTREEAIEVIEQDIPCEHDTDLIKALDMAISALNSLEEVYAKGYNDGFTQAEINFENDKALSQEPCESDTSIEQALLLEVIDKFLPKSGKWIDINGIYAECSNCNEEIYITGDFNYCPNCGARMERSDKE